MAVEPLLGTRAQKGFIATVMLQAIIVLVMVVIAFAMIEHTLIENGISSHQRYKTISCYLALFGLAEIFEAVMAFDALRMRNVIQLVGIILFHTAIIVFAALQVHETHTALAQDTAESCRTAFDYINCGGPGSLFNKIEPFLIVVPCVIAVSLFGVVFWVRELYHEFGWAIFHIVGANPKMKSMYEWYQIMICLLKFDFFAFAGVTIQLLILVLSEDTAEFGITIAAVPVVLGLLILCGVAVQREIKWIMTISLAMMVAAMGYFLFKLVRFYEPSTSSQYLSTRATLTTFTVVAFLLLLATFAVGLRCFADFDKGLEASKMHGQSYAPIKAVFPMNLINGQKQEPPTPGVRQSSYFGGGPIGRQLSIE